MNRPSALDLAPRSPRKRWLTATAVLLAATTLSSCGGDAARSGDAAGRPSARPASPATSAKPAAPRTAGTLALVPDGRAARTRLAYADRARLRAADLPLAAATVTAAVLGRGAGDANVVVGTRRTAFRPAAAPETSAITPTASSAVQSCLGDALAQTIVGPGALGDDSALGAGLAVSGDKPAGVQLRICAAPRLIRNLHQTERALERRLGPVRGTVVTGTEIGEREIMTGTVAARRLPARQVRAILAGGPALRALAPWR